MVSSQLKLGLGLGLAFFVLGAGAFSYFPNVSNQDYEPEQPMPFSHKIHAGDNKIACMYCHSAPEKSRHSTIPSMNVCMNCHTVVKADSPYIKKLQEYYKEGRSIEWVRVHELPDYVYFPHKRHLARGLVCLDCHGDVKTMERVYQFSPLTMGWCIDCHRGKTTPKTVVAQMFPGKKNYQGPVATVNCSACHF